MPEDKNNDVKAAMSFLHKDLNPEAKKVIETITGLRIGLEDMTLRARDWHQKYISLHQLLLIVLKKHFVKGVVLTNKDFEDTISSMYRIRADWNEEETEMTLSTEFYLDNN